ATALIEIARLRQHRLIRNVRRGDTRVELSLDELEALDGDRVVASRWELEAELKGGDREDLRELANALSTTPGLGFPYGQKRLFAMVSVATARAAATADAEVSPEPGIRPSCCHNPNRSGMNHDSTMRSPA